MSSGSIILSWNEAKGKKVKSSDDKDLGKIQNVTRDYIEIKEGLISKKRYFIPKYYIQGYDGDHLYTAITKDEIRLALVLRNKKYNRSVKIHYSLK
jgi:hypothetical protein